MTNPTAFWWLSFGGGICLFTYFLRRGDPVGMAGQGFGLIVYTRNLYFIHVVRRRPLRVEDDEASAKAEG